MSDRRAGNFVAGKDEAGASLILALVFLIVVSLIVISIAGLTAADLRLTSSYSAAQSMTAAADGATEVAVQQVRYDFEQSTLNNPAPCSAQQSFNSQPMQAWCDTLWNPLSASTRTVIVSTCPSAVTSGVVCEATPFLQAIVVYDDYPSTNSNSSCVPVIPPQTSQNPTTCGSQMDLQSWAYNVTPPTVTKVTTTAQNLCTPGTITITGTGFTPTSTVAYVSASQFNQNVVYQAKVKMVSATGTEITATSPDVTSTGDTYYVVVTGSTGASAYGPSTSAPSWSC